MAVVLDLHYNATAALTERGGLWVCGSREYGSLGLGPPTGPNSPARANMALLGGVGTPVTGCEGGGPRADTHPFRNKPLVMVHVTMYVAMGHMHVAMVHVVMHVAMGHMHVAAVTDRGVVWIWGLN